MANSVSQPLQPLAGLTAIELSTEGPVPFAARVLTDLGATVLRVTGPRASHDTLGVPLSFQPLVKGRESVCIDLKTQDGRDAFLERVCAADVVLEGYRPGVAARLGIGAGACLAANPRLIYAHVSGYGMAGPLAAMPGHDINFIGLSGVLSTLGRPGTPPPPPQGLIGDFGGGGTFLTIGILAALYRLHQSGQGCSFSVSMIGASAMLAAETYGLHAADRWGERGENLFDGGAPFYDCYETADGLYMAVGALEPKFYANLLTTLGIPHTDFRQYQREDWPSLRARLAAIFRQRTQAEWEAVFEVVEACVTPVMGLATAPTHPQNAANHVFDRSNGMSEPGPPLRFSSH